MRRTFLIWLSAVILATFLVMGALVYSQFSRHARERAEQVMATRLNDMLELFLHAERSVSYLSRANDSSTLDRTRALAEIISLCPDYLRKQEDLQGICNYLGAEQIAVCNEEGVVEAAVPEAYVGLNIRDSDDLHLLIGKESAAGGDMFGGDTEHPGVMQYASVPRLDKPGIVRLGFRTRLEQLSREESSLDRSTAKLRLGMNGRVVIYRRGVCVAGSSSSMAQTEYLSIPPNVVREVTLDGTDYFLYAVDGEGYRLVGVLPVAEIYRSSLNAVQTVLVSNLALFLIMFLVVSCLLQRVVLRGISRVNEALREITEGDLEKRVEVTDNPEFARLSNGINFMVDSLRSVGEERQQSMRRGLELARSLQNTVLPDKFPPFPDINTFDLYACCMQANEVGGDFYDFSMPDEQHLHFLVADVADSGIPAAFFMMRAISIIRTLSKSDASPVSVVSGANRELCGDSQAGISMALFYGNLNITTGELEYVNAGQLCALLQHEDEEYRPLCGKPEPMVGETPEAEYRSELIRLKSGDRLLLYTEGVMGVTNSHNTPFNEKRLREALRGAAPTVTDVLQLVRSSLRRYAEGTRFPRDITMLCLEYKGAPVSRTGITLPAGQAAEAEELIAARLEELFAAPLDIADVQAAVRAVLGSLPPELTVRLDFHFTEQLAEVAISYPGPPCDPLQQLAGLAVDRSAYDYTDDQVNKLTLWKNLI